MTDIVLNPTIFNTAKSEAEHAVTQLFLGAKAGVFDTIHKNFPEIWDHYKNLRSLDWDANEFDYSTCKIEFLTADPLVAKRMIKTIAWQWEADSVAAHSLLTIMAPFISSPELFAAYARITENEVLHATTYSEIVRLSFDNPEQVLKDVLGEQEALRRLRVVADIMGEVHDTAHLYAVNHRLPAELQVSDEQAYEAALLYVVTMLALERCQFAPSFAVTFAITMTNQFMPIGQGVGKIFQDELEVHVAVGKAVLRRELATERGKKALAKLRPRIEAMLDDIVTSEFAWTDWMEFDEHPLPGLNGRNLKGFVLYSEADVRAELGFEPKDRGMDVPTTNPLSFMDKMLNTGKTQNANMEVQNGQYKVNLLQRDDTNKLFDVDF